MEITLKELRERCKEGGLFSYMGFLYMLTDIRVDKIFEIGTLNIRGNGWIYVPPKIHYIDDECVVNFIREM